MALGPSRVLIPNSRMDVDILLDNSLVFRADRLLIVTVTGVGQAWHVGEGEAQRVRRGGGDRTETLVLLSKPPSLYLSPTLLSPLFFFLIVTHFFGARRFFCSFIIDAFMFIGTYWLTAGRVVVV